jgi:N6-adenosine-specific RNA methylase IME4
MRDLAIQQIDKVRAMLERATTLPELRELVSVADAARVYAKRALCTLEVVNHAQRIKLSAERKAGEMLTKIEKDKGGGNVRGVHRSRAATGERLEDLGVTKSQSSRWQMLAAIPEREFEKAFDAHLNRGREVTSAFFQKMAMRHRPKNGAVRVSKSDKGGVRSDLADLDKGKFGCIYADPPWTYDNTASRGAARNHYETMTVDELCALPVGELAAPEAHLHLWTTNAFLFECQRILDAWGFEYKSTFVWVKPQMGMGNYWRNAHEIMLLGVRGGLRGQSASERSWMEHERGLHSEKPEAVRERIERLSPGPYLELFGRKSVPGWTVFGNQLLK